MKKHIIIITAITLLISNSCGCGTKKAYVSGERYLPTGIMPREAIVILLNESMKHHVNIESEGKEHSVESCMGNAMNSVNPQLKIVSAKEFRRALFPGKKFKDAPRSAEALLLSLQDEESRHHVQDLGIRYLIVVDTDTHKYGEKTEFAAQGGVWAVGQSWTRYSNFLAFVIDVKQPAKSGSFSSSSSGNAGFAVPFFYIVPLPPVPLIAATESEACSSLGTAVVNFLEGHEDPNIENTE